MFFLPLFYNVCHSEKGKRRFLSFPGCRQFWELLSSVTLSLTSFLRFFPIFFYSLSLFVSTTDPFQAVLLLFLLLMIIFCSSSSSSLTTTHSLFALLLMMIKWNENQSFKYKKSILRRLLLPHIFFFLILSNSNGASASSATASVTCFRSASGFNSREKRDNKKNQKNGINFHHLLLPKDSSWCSWCKSFGYYNYSWRCRSFVIRDSTYSASVFSLL